MALKENPATPTSLHELQRGTGRRHSQLEHRLSLVSASDRPDHGALLRVLARAPLSSADDPPGLDVCKVDIVIDIYIYSNRHSLPRTTHGMNTGTKLLDIISKQSNHSNNYWPSRSCPSNPEPSKSRSGYPAIAIGTGFTNHVEGYATHQSASRPTEWRF